MARFSSRLPAAVLLSAAATTPSDAETPAPDCTLAGAPLYGNVQVVASFPDIRVQIVDSFPDLRVKIVDSFPDTCGAWRFVESFPDFKIQYVDSFPDLKIQFVESFPGLP
ncbi:MAG: hypothetical protein ACE5FO_01180 [Parvularculaceae bacterium]